MKILILSWKHPMDPTAGGAERYLVEVARRWTASGHQVTILTPCPSDPWTEGAGSPRENGIQYVGVGTEIDRLPGGAELSPGLWRHFRPGRGVREHSALRRPHDSGRSGCCPLSPDGRRGVAAGVSVPDELARSACPRAALDTRYATCPGGRRFKKHSGFSESTRCRDRGRDPTRLCTARGA